MLEYIDKQFFDDLVTVLKIRNQFAHRLEIKSLEQNPIKNWIKGMNVYAVMSRLLLKSIPCAIPSVYASES